MDLDGPALERTRRMQATNSGLAWTQSLINHGLGVRGLEGTECQVAGTFSLRDFRPKEQQ